MAPRPPATPSSRASAPSTGRTADPGRADLTARTDEPTHTGRARRGNRGAKARTGKTRSYTGA